MKYVYEMKESDLSANGVLMMNYYDELHKKDCSDVVKKLIEDAIKSRIPQINTINEDMNNMNTPQEFMNTLSEYNGCVTNEAKTAIAVDCKRFFMESAGPELFSGDKYSIECVRQGWKNNRIVVTGKILFKDIQKDFDVTKIDMPEEHFINMFLDSFVRPRILKKLMPEDLPKLGLKYACVVGMAKREFNGVYRIDVSYSIAVKNLTDNLAATIMNELEIATSETYY